MINRLYPIGVQNFEKLRKNGYLYIDKTELIYQLVRRGTYYFLSRPRRFGKSLLLSTLMAYFQGKKELFKGLAIEQLEKDWQEHPVFHLDLNIEKYDTPESLQYILDNAVSKWEDLYGSRPSEVTLSLRFAGVIERAYQQTGQRVVILVDEYDKPMLQTIGNEELQAIYRTTLKPFYGVLKSMDGCIKFALLTGVTKFGKVSVFSDLNNLNDISMDEPYAAICGITEQEIHDNFEEDIHQLAAAQKLTYDDVCRELKKRYDGYHFMENSIGIYNPFSLLNTFYKMKFGSYWFETGTPTYLVELLKRIDSISRDPIPVIYQSGYLTIKEYDEEFGLYKLGFPNMEVEEGFVRFLLPFNTPVDKVKTGFEIQQFVREIENGECWCEL